MPGIVIRGRARRANADHLAAGPRVLEPGADAIGQRAAADRHEHGIERNARLCQFAGDGSGAFGDLRPIAVFDEERARLGGGVVLGGDVGGIEIAAREPHIGTQRPHPLDLQRVGGGRGEHRDLVPPPRAG